jgi:hypothetical protein
MVFLISRQTSRDCPSVLLTSVFFSSVLSSSAVVVHYWPTCVAEKASSKETTETNVHSQNDTLN